MSRDGGGLCFESFFFGFIPLPPPFKKGRVSNHLSGIYASLRPEHAGGLRSDPHVLAVGRLLFGGTYLSPWTTSPAYAGVAPGGVTLRLKSHTPPDGGGPWEAIKNRRTFMTPG